MKREAKLYVMTPKLAIKSTRKQAEEGWGKKLNQTRTERVVHLEQTYKVAREHMAARLSPSFVKQLTAPPPIFRCSRDRDYITRLEIKLFFNSGIIVVKRFHYITKR
jgi:hypothetical protein